MSVRRRTRRADPAFEAFSTAFYCSWGRHRTFQSSTVAEQFDQGTMCMECQMKVADSLTQSLFLPEMSAALHAEERRRFEKAREARATVAAIDPGGDGLVYYIRINGQVKIGFTTNLTQRSRSYPPGSELLAVEPGTRYTERERHQDFARHLVRGREWFNESAEIRAHISALADAYGVPDTLMHRYTERPA